MPDIRITIGGRLDRSVQDSFAEFKKLGKDAADAVNRDLTGRGGGGGRGRGGNPELEAARAAHAEQSRLNRMAFREQLLWIRRAHDEERKLARDRAKEKLSDLREEAREKAKNERAAASLDRQRSAGLYREFKANERELDRLATRTSHRATRFFFPAPEGALGYAKRTAHELMRGVGVDLNFGASVARNVANARGATMLSNQGWAPQEFNEKTGKWEENPFENRIKASEIRSRTQEIGNKYGFSEEEVRAFAQEYTNLTGSLKGALDLIPRLALLAKATGTELGEMGQAAADMGVQLEGVKDKERVLGEVMGIATMQGKTGAMELFQLAKFMPRIVSLTGQFQGERGTSMANLLASVQLIRRFGGTGNPAQATTALGGAVAALNQGGGKKFAKYGIKTANEQGQLRSLEDIAVESINASFNNGKFDRKKFFDMWNAIRGGRLATGLLTVYNGAGGSKINPLTGKTMGEEAVRQQYQKFTQGFSVEAQEKLAAQSVDGVTARAQKFQMAFDKVVQQSQDRLLPTLEKLSPVALRVVDVFGRVASWSAENPIKGVGALLGVSVARAVTESLGRAMLERVMRSPFGMNAAAGWDLGPSANGLVTKRNALGKVASVGGVFGAVGAGVALGALAYEGIDVVGKSEFDKNQKGTDEIFAMLRGKHGKDLIEALPEAEKKLEALKKDRSTFGEIMDFFGAGGVSGNAELTGAEDFLSRKNKELNEFTGAGGKFSPVMLKEMEAEKAIKERQEKQLDPKEIGRGTADALKGQILDVRLVNAKDIGRDTADGGPEVDDSGRRGPGAKK